jgi:murein DD-endopeptidase MepM/ murein hydrolase activator NlpD
MLRRPSLRAFFLPAAHLASVLVLDACGAPRQQVTTTPAVSRSADVEYLLLRQLIVPVRGVHQSDIAESFDHARGARGERRHDAIDIMAPRGTPVLSADDGRVLKLRRNRAGGITVYAIDPADRYVYYYAHLERYRAGLREGMKLSKGDVLGYVGTTGNAPKNAPHLHFAILRMGADRKWWTGTPIDPRPLLGGRLEASSQETVAPRR